MRGECQIYIPYIYLNTYISGFKVASDKTLYIQIKKWPVIKGHIVWMDLNILVNIYLKTHSNDQFLHGA